MNKDIENKLGLILVPPSIKIEIAIVCDYKVKKYKNKRSWVNVPINQYIAVLLNLYP